MFCNSQNKSDGKNRKNSLSTDLHSKAKNFKKRCNILIKQVASTIQINPIARSISRQSKIHNRSISPAINSRHDPKSARGTKIHSYRDAYE